MKKVFFGGSRRLGRLNPQVKSRAENMIAEGLQILVGDANGADKAIQGFFSERGYDNVVVFHAGDLCRNNLGHWSTRAIKVDRAPRDFRFFTAKDIAMSDEADYGFMIWDGESQGTVNNVLNLLERGKKVVVYLSPDREFITFRTPADANELLKRIDRELADVLEKKVGLRRRVSASAEVDLIGEGVFSPRSPHRNGMRVRTGRFAKMEHTMTSSIPVGAHTKRTHGDQALAGQPGICPRFVSPGSSADASSFCY